MPKTRKKTEKKIEKIEKTKELGKEIRVKKKEKAKEISKLLETEETELAVKGKKGITEEAAAEVAAETAEEEAKAAARSLKEEEEIKRKKKELGELLVPIEDYLRCGIYIGTKTIMPGMKHFVYKKRADGLGILNTKFIDDKLRAASELLAQYAPEEIIFVCKREAGWRALEQVSALTGIRCFLKKYPAGIITNITLENFFEPSIALISDSWLDKNALFDAVNLGIPVIGLCDTNNLTRYVDLIIPCNNKSDKSLGLVFWILCREYIKKRGMKVKMPPLETFTGPLEPAEPVATPIAAA